MAKLNPIELQKALKGVDYPASKDDLVSAAQNNGATDDLMDALRGPAGDHFNTPADVTEAVDFDGNASS
jgi:hypothetical protein